MFIDIKELSAEGKIITGEIALDPSAWKDEDIEVSNVVYRISLEPEKKGVYLDGLMDASISLTCSRCLEMYPLFLHVPFSLTLVEGYRESEEGDRQLDEDKVDYFPMIEGKVDLNEILSEQVYLNIPLKPLCRTGCKGLCSRCGENLNRDQCRCSIVSQ